MLTFELTLKSGRIFERDAVDEQALMHDLSHGTYLKGKEPKAVAQPKHEDWLQRFRTNEVESFRRIV